MVADPWTYYNGQWFSKLNKSSWAGISNKVTCHCNSKKICGAAAGLKEMHLCLLLAKKKIWHYPSTIKNILKPSNKKKKCQENIYIINLVLGV